MFSSNKSRSVHQLVLVAIMLLTVLACRTTNLVRQRFVTPEVIADDLPTDAPMPAALAADAVPSIPSAPKRIGTTPTRAGNLVRTPTPTSKPTSTDIPPQPSPTVEPILIAPTATPTNAPTVIPTRPPVVRAPVSVPTKAPAPTKIAPTPTPSYQYQVDFSWCGPNWQTFVEGTVMLDGVPQNGLLVRISLDPDGSPAPANDYLTGMDSTKPGGYTQIIDANAPHGGLWYLWVVDPKTLQRISKIATVKTDSKRVEETSCQSATVNFSNQP